MTFSAYLRGLVAHATWVNWLMLAFWLLGGAYLMGWRGLGFVVLMLSIAVITRYYEEV